MTSPVGYRNPDGDQGRIEPVAVLTHDQAFNLRQAQELRARVAEGRRAEQLLRALQDECKHEVFADEPGFIYDMRSCVVCGYDLGFI